ncbi:MAG: glycosyltransferase family 2 protein [Vicinamibacterales bacterium]
MTPPVPDVSVIIVNYNGRRHLAPCLAALAAQEGPAFEVVLVDNGSSDGSAGLVAEQFPWVRLVALDENLGFAGGNNRGVAAARGRLLVFLNNDTVVEAGWLQALCGGLEWGPSVGIVAAQIVYLHDPSVLDSAGDGLTRAGGAYKRGHGGPATRYLRRREVFAACGCSCLVPRDVFDEVGGFDEDFFVSHEDVDLSYRIRLRGYRCVYMPEAVVRHAGSATLGRTSPLAVFHGQRNLEWLYVKNTPPALLLWTLPAHLVYVAAAGVYFTAVGRLPTFVRAKWAALVGLPAMWRKRRSIQAARRVPDKAIWELLDAGWMAVKLREKRFDLRVADEP